jgi:hypothetical protein
MISFEMFLEAEEGSNEVIVKTIDTIIDSAIKLKQGHITIDHYVVGKYKYKDENFYVTLSNDIASNNDNFYWKIHKIKEPDFTRKVMSIIDFKKFLVDECKANEETLTLDDKSF